MKSYSNYLILVFIFHAFVLHAQEEPVDISDLSLNDQLIIMADRGDTNAVLKLIREGASINASTYEGVTPLMYAAQNGYTDMVLLLLRYGADPDVKPFNGYTALISAIRAGYIETAEWLIRKGADINLADYDGVTPLMHAIKTDTFYLPDMLLYYDALVDPEDNQGVDALMLTGKYGNYEIAFTLLEKGCNINSTDHSGNTPLHYATAAGNCDIMELFIVNGASLESKNQAGYTPLSLAVAQNDFNAARLLISYGADVNIRINKSITPLNLALDNHNDSLIFMLKNHNARALSRPNLNQYGIGIRYSFNRQDARWDLSFGIHDNKYKLMTNMTVGFRPKARQVMEQESEHVYYQYWERRAVISASVDKAFFVNTIGHKTLTAGAFAGIGGGVTFGSYKGSDNHPDMKLIFTPRIGCMGETRHLRLKICYEYMNLHLEDYTSGWFSLSLELLFNAKKRNLYLP